MGDVTMEELFAAGDVVQADGVTKGPISRIDWGAGEPMIYVRPYPATRRSTPAGEPELPSEEGPFMPPQVMPLNGAKLVLWRQRYRAPAT